MAKDGYVMGPVESAPLRSGGEARGGDDRSDLLREMEIEFRTIAGRRERLPCVPLRPLEVWSAGALNITFSVETKRKHSAKAYLECCEISREFVGR